MIEEDPFNPKWWDFLGRENYLLDNALGDTLIFFEKGVCLCEKNDVKNKYFFDILTYLCKVLIEQGMYSKSITYINKLEEHFPGSVDLVYFKSILLYQDCINRMKKIKSDLCNYKDSGSMLNSNADHIKSMYILLMLQ